MSDKGLILIVDDLPQNLQLLHTTLRSAGYKVAVANTAAVALGFLERSQPDLILLDVMMPEINGFELCQQLKTMPSCQAIPVIFLTARTDKTDILQGFEAGGVDYITKPFENLELLSRVQVHVALKKTQDALRQTNAELQRLNQEKGEFLGIASHDLKNPLTAILMHAETLAQDQSLNPATRESAQVIRQSGQRMTEIIHNLLEIHRLEDGRLELRQDLCDLQDLLSESIGQHLTQARRKNITLQQRFSPELCLVESDWQLLLQILDNLLSNAIKYAPPGSEVEIGMQAEGAQVKCWIADQGPGFTAADQQQMYQKFARLSARPTAGEHSTGLGLSIVRRLCDLLQIQLSCTTAPAKGSCFMLSLQRLTDLPAIDEATVP